MSKQSDRIRRVESKRPRPERAPRVVVEHAAEDDPAAREVAIGILWRMLDQLEAGEA